jgi:hypothetical protein
LEVVGRYPTTAALLADLKASEDDGAPLSTVYDITPEESELGENGTRVKLSIDS